MLKFSGPFVNRQNEHDPQQKSWPSRCYFTGVMFCLKPKIVLSVRVYVFDPIRFPIEQRMFIFN